MTTQFTGRVAVVTGATGSIGRAVVGDLAQGGATVVAMGRDEAQLKDVLATLPAGPPHRSVTAELTDAEGVQRAVDSIVDEFARIDIVVNNAGGWRGSAPGDFLGKTFEQLHGEAEGNLVSTVFLCRAVLPVMVERGGGRIVNVSSIAGLIALPGHSAYSAAKLGLSGLSRQLGVEFGRSGVTVNCVAPGAVATPIAEQLLAQEHPMMVGMRDATPTGRLTMPSEIASLISFLASDGAAQINGETIAVDGGAAVA